MYSIDASDLTLSHTVTDSNMRNLFFGAQNMYFEGTAADAAATMTSQLTFNIVFSDACRSANVEAQSISFPTMIWSQDSTYELSVPAFTDSVDTTNSYTTGICGEKSVTLDASTPSFLTI